jgi:hypothetical protein
VAPSPISCARSLFWEKKPFDGEKRIEKREKKEEKPCPNGPGRFSAAETCGWPVFELPLVTAAVSIYTTKMWYLNPIENGTTNLTI